MARNAELLCGLALCHGYAPSSVRLCIDRICTGTEERQRYTDRSGKKHIPVRRRLRNEIPRAEECNGSGGDGRPEPCQEEEAGHTACDREGYLQDSSIRMQLDHAMLKQVGYDRNP